MARMRFGWVSFFRHPHQWPWFCRRVTWSGCSQMAKGLQELWMQAQRNGFRSIARNRLMRPLSGLSPEGREEGVGDMDFEVLGRLAACLANEHMAINHRSQQEGDGNLWIDSATQKTALFSPLDDVGQCHAGRFDDPRAPDGTHGTVVRGVGNQMRHDLFSHHLPVRCRVIAQLRYQVRAKVAGVEDRAAPCQDRADRQAPQGTMSLCPASGGRWSPCLLPRPWRSRPYWWPQFRALQRRAPPPHDLTVRLRAFLSCHRLLLEIYTSILEKRYAPAAKNGGDHSQNREIERALKCHALISAPRRPSTP